MRAGYLRFLIPFAILAGCEAVKVPVSGLSQKPPETSLAVDAPSLRSTRSLELSAYYERVQSDLLAKGLLRQDGGGADVPFTQDDLVENFVRIALFEEYANTDGRIVARQTPSVLHRWEQPVRMAVHFGETVPPEQRQTDRANIGNYVARLSRITGLDMRLSRTNPNFDVYIVNDEERRGLGQSISEVFPGIGRAALEAVTDMPRSTFCLVFAYDPDDQGKYTRALAVIRAEHPDVLRLSCVHEEIAQGLGLSNDSPRARPSVFNDDEEFGLLTYHDELLLRILYDDRMQTGMTPETARPVAKEIAAELLPQIRETEQNKEAI